MKDNTPDKGKIVAQAVQIATRALPSVEISDSGAFVIQRTRFILQVSIPQG